MNVRRLTYDERLRCVFMSEQGQTNRQIGRKMNCSHTAVGNILKKYERTGTVKDDARTGRPCRLNSRIARRLVRDSLKNRRKTAVQMKDELKAEGVKVGVTTIKRALYSAQLFGHVARRKPLLRKMNVGKRLA
jgi:transposase